MRPRRRSTLSSRTSRVAAIAKTPSLKVSSRVVPDSVIRCEVRLAHAVDGSSLLRPITFVLAIVAAVVVGNRTDSFWYGLLAWFVAMGVGRVVGAVVRGRLDRALVKAIWPGAATAYAFLFDWLGLPPGRRSSSRSSPPR